MIKKLYFIFLMISFAPQFLSANDKIPAREINFVEYETNARTFLRHGDYVGMLELRGRWEGENQEFRYRSITAGGYYRLYKQPLHTLKLGAFYRRQQGVRHEDDWIAVSGNWFWVDARERAENEFIADVSPRLKLDFLPGDGWVLTSKTRYHYNFTNKEQTLFLRPGLTLFLVKRW